MGLQEKWRMRGASGLVKILGNTTEILINTTILGITDSEVRVCDSETLRYGQRLERPALSLWVKMRVDMLWNL